MASVLNVQFTLNYASVLNSYTFKNDPLSIQKELMINGPLVFTALRMYEDFLYYRTGVYEHKAGRYLGLHAIRLIGWGVETDGTKYWTVANSWNNDWVGLLFQC